LGLEPAPPKTSPGQKTPQEEYADIFDNVSPDHDNSVTDMASRSPDG